MTSVYEGLIFDLKIKLKNKNIKFNKIFSLINNQKYDEIIEDDTIKNLIKNIVAERETIGNNIENKLNDLLWLNDRLIQFGEEPQSTKTKVFINIYDLETEKYERRTTMQLLKKELRIKRDRRFPLCSAKANQTLRCFLIKL